jgi:hypothetical protein
VSSLLHLSCAWNFLWVQNQSLLQYRPTLAFWELKIHVCAQFLVKRKGLPFHDFGLVDANAAKRQRLEPGEGASAAAVPVSLAMVEVVCGWHSLPFSFLPLLFVSVIHD